MAYFRKLVGEQCYLSPIDPEDAPRFAAWVNDPEVAAGVTLARQVLGVERTRDKLARHAGRQAYFTIVALDGDEPIGECGIDDISDVDRTGELLILIGDKRFWNRGFGTDAVRLLLRFGFLTLGSEQHPAARARLQRTGDPLLREDAASSSAATGPTPGTTTGRCTAAS